MTTTDLHNGWNVVLGQGEGFEARLFDAVTGEQMERSRFERKHLEGDANFDGWKSEEELASAVLAWTSENPAPSMLARIPRGYKIAVVPQSERRSPDCPWRVTCDARPGACADRPTFAEALAAASTHHDNRMRSGTKIRRK